MAKAAEPATILVVLDSFDGEVDGQVLNFRKGLVIQSEHPAVRKWPDKFGPMKYPYPLRDAPRIEQATAAPGEKRGA